MSRKDRRRTSSTRGSSAITATERSATARCDWAAIARSAGYYDQAHLIGDFRDLVGLTPVAYLERRSGAGIPRQPAEI